MPDHSGRATDSTAPEDRVPLAEKLGDGLGTLVDLWGHWLYPNLATQVFNIYLGVSPALVSLALMINRLVSAASDPLFSRLSDNARTRFGRRRPFILVGAVLAGFGLQLLFLVSPGWGATRLHFIASGSIALASAGYWMLDGSIGADIMDNDELESGTRREGAFSACGSWVTKGGIAARIGASGFILAATGFDSKLGGAQAAHTHLMIRLFLAGVPIRPSVRAARAVTLFADARTDVRDPSTARAQALEVLANARDSVHAQPRGRPRRGYQKIVSNPAVMPMPL